MQRVKSANHTRRLPRKARLRQPPGEELCANREKRRRRWSELTEQELLDAAEKLLGRIPFRQLTVQAVTAGAGLARSSFYNQFRDMHDLLARLVSRHLDQIRRINESWGRVLEKAPALESPQGFQHRGAALREVLTNGYRLYQQHYHLMRALYDEASISPAIEALRRRYLDETMRSAAEQFRKVPRTGHARSVDTDEMAHIMTLMYQSYVLDKLARGGRQNPAEAAETAATLFECMMYGELPESVRPVKPTSKASYKP